MCAVVWNVILSVISHAKVAPPAPAPAPPAKGKAAAKGKK
jgi:hypothetical protein